MGVLISRFRRKQTTIEVLEGIDKDINRLQKNRKVNQDRQKHFVTSLLIFSIAVYIIAAIIFFCVYFPDTWQLRFLYSLPLLVFPFLVWGIKKLLHWYFVKRISSNDLALQQLRERKRQILEDVMETETYKRAREILEKFDPSRLRKLEIGSPDAGRTPQVTVSGTPGMVIQQRTVRTTQNVRGVTSIPSRVPGPTTPTPVAQRSRQPVMFPSPPAPQAPVRTVSPLQSQIRTPMPSQIRTPMPSQIGTPVPSQPAIRGGFSGGVATLPGLPMPRSVLPRERGTMDRLMDYLVGDGPENRYALVCQNCFSHNGMALKEEFEYLSFRCCYCYTLNPAKKQRPVAPKLEFFAPGSKVRQITGIVASNEESDDDSVDRDDEDYSEQDSIESDNSPSISPSQLANPPTFSKSASSNSSLPNQSQTSDVQKSTDGGHPQPQATKGSDVKAASSPVRLRSRQTQGHVLQTLETYSATGSQLPKLQLTQASSVTAGQLPKVQLIQTSSRTGSQLPKVQTSQLSKVPVAKVIGRESSTELKDLPQTDKNTANEGANLAEAQTGRRVTSEREIPAQPLPTELPSVSITSTEGSSNSRSADSGISQSKTGVDVCTSEGASSVGS